MKICLRMFSNFFFLPVEATEIKKRELMFEKHRLRGLPEKIQNTQINLNFR